MAAALFTAFLLVPLAEIYVILRVGHYLGFLPTLAILLAGSIFGAALVKREGTRAWRTLKATLGAGRIPGREMADAALVLVGGVLLLTPGFLTDAVGLLLVLPITRPLARRLLTWLTLRRFVPLGARTVGVRVGARTVNGMPRRRRGSGIVIEGETLPPRTPGGQPPGGQPPGGQPPGATTTRPPLSPE